VFDGERVPLLAPNGIFKPRICSVPLSITTVPAKEDGSPPYDDAIGTDGLLRYRYRGCDIIDIDHRDNAGLREAMRRRVPLIYFHGIVEGKYEAEYPVFIVGDSPESFAFTVTVDERRFASLGNLVEDSTETDIRRRYVTRTVQQRLHQQEFREREDAQVEAVVVAHRDLLVDLDVEHGVGRLREGSVASMQDDVLPADRSGCSGAGRQVAFRAGAAAEPRRLDLCGCLVLRDDIPGQDVARVQQLRDADGAGLATCPTLGTGTARSPTTSSGSPDA